MLEKVRCSDARDVIIPAAEVESDFLASLDFHPRILSDSASYSHWLLQQHEILEPIYSKAAWEARRDSRKAGKQFRGAGFQAYAGTKLRLETWLDSEGEEVFLPEDPSRSVLQKLEVEPITERLKQFEKNPSFRTAKKAMKGNGYNPDGLLVGKRIHPVELALWPDQKYLDKKPFPFQLAQSEYNIFDKETRIHLLSPSDSEFGIFSERIFRLMPTEITQGTVRTFLRELYYAYRPTQDSQTLSEQGFNLLDSRNYRSQRKRQERARQQFAYRPSRP